MLDMLQSTKLFSFLIFERGDTGEKSIALLWLLVMSSKLSDVAGGTSRKTPACKICCACPQQRRARDECTIFRSFEECAEEINAFYKCLLDEGFTEDEVAKLRKNVKPM